MFSRIDVYRAAILLDLSRQAFAFFYQVARRMALGADYATAYDVEKAIWPIAAEWQPE